MKTTLELVDWVRDECREQKITDPQAVKPLLAQRMKEILSSCYAPLAQGGDLPTVYLVVGVNGTGKTTTVGKLAARCQRRGEKVVGAVILSAPLGEQRKPGPGGAGRDNQAQAGADPAAVAHDAADAAGPRPYLIIDTPADSTKSTSWPSLKDRKGPARSLGRRQTISCWWWISPDRMPSPRRRCSRRRWNRRVVLTKLDGTAKENRLSHQGVAAGETIGGREVSTI